MEKDKAKEEIRGVTEEFSHLVEQLGVIQARLQELAGNELDAVLLPDGRSFLLHQAQERLRESELIFHALFENMLEGCAYCRVLFEGAEAVDFLYLRVNRAFETQTGLRDVAGKKFSEVLPSVLRTNPEIFATYARVAQSGQAEKFETHIKELGIWLSISVHSSKSEHFVVIFENITARKEAEDEMRLQTAFLEAQLNSALDGILVVDQHCHKVYQNKMTVDLFQLPEEIAASHGEDTQFLWVADAVKDRKAFLEQAEFLVANPREICHDELELKNGTVLDRYSAPVVGQDGYCYGRIYTFRDITERKKVEKNLQLLSSAVTQSRESVVITGADLELPGPQIIFVNPAFTQMTGYTPEEIIGQTPRILQGAKTDKATIDRLRETLKKGEIFSGETTNYRKDGTPYSQEWNISPIFDKNGTITHFVSTQRDVSARKKSEEELLENQQRLALATESARIGIWDWDVTADKMYWDQRMIALYGIKEEDFTGAVDTWQKGMHPDDKERAQLEIDRALSEKGQIHSEFRVVWPNGEVRHMEAHGLVKRGIDGNAIRMIGVNWDVTDRKRLEQQFLRAQRMEGIGTLAGGIAHDLNNMLSPIIMSIELLKMRFDDPASRDLLTIIGSSAQRGADMVSQVLSFARGVEGRRMEVQVKHLLKDLEKLASETFPKNIEVRSILPAELWTIVGDPTQLHQVLLNLCVNARDAMPNGGSLTLIAENLFLDEFYVALNPEASVGPYVVIQSVDTGTGMSASVVEKIFDPFFTTKDLGKGTGLGLSTTMAIVKSHGGFVRVYSELGKGTKFYIYLPATNELSIASHEELEADIPRGNGELVLVVDDEFSVRHIAQQTLSTFGYRVILANDGAEAVAVYAARKDEIGVVLTDMMMPYMDGAGTIRVLQKLNPKVRIVAASGLAANSEVAAMGVHYFLPKPYTADAMLWTLKRALQDEK